MQKIFLPLALLFALNATAQSFTAGNVVIYRVGTGSAALSSSSTAVYLDEYTPSGSLVQSVAMPVAASAGNFPLTTSGSATSEGLLNLSVNGNYLVVTGYGAAPGISSIAGTSGTTVPRIVGFVDNQKAINTTTALSDFSSANNPRSAISTDGNLLWASGAGGLRYATQGSTSSVQLNTANLRDVKIFNGQLYISSGSGSVRIGTVGSGTPTTSGQTITSLPGFPTNTSPYQFQFFDLSAAVPGNDVLYVADDAAGIQKYSLVSGSWVLNGTIGADADDYRGLTGIASGATVTLYATRKGSELVRLVDATGYNSAPAGTPVLLATAATNTAFRGIAFAPAASANTLTLTFTPVSTSAFLTPPIVSTVISDPTDPLANAGLLVDVKDNGVSLAAADYTLTASSNNTSVVGNANINIAKANGQATIKLTATGVGYSDVMLTLTKGSFSKTLSFSVAASAASATPANTRFHTGASDASAAIALDDDYMLVADDEMNKLFVYNRTNSGLPVTSFDYSGLLSLTDLDGAVLREVDVEGAVRSKAAASRIYFIGSMSNGGSSFNARPNRNRVFAMTVNGTGNSTAFAYVGMYASLRQDLINWGNTNGYNFTSSAAAGKDPKQIDGFNLEGITLAPDNTTAYIAFRAPLVPAASRTKALLAPIPNFETWFNNGSPAGSPSIGAPIELNLGGRGFRDIVRLSNGTYVILAGNYDDTPLNPAIYTWDGNAGSAPVLRSSFTLTAMNPEAVMEVQAGGNLQADRLQLLSDNGGTEYYNDGTSAKDLTQNNDKKFRSDLVISSTGNVLPLIFNSFTVQKMTGTFLLTWEMALPVMCNGFTIERSTDGRSFSTIAKMPANANVNAYQFTDLNTDARNIYYRIAATGTDGEMKYSPTRLLINSSAELFTIYPNPAKDQIQISTTIEGQKYIYLFNSSGQKLKTFSFTGLATGFSIGDLPKGKYYLLVLTVDKILTAKTLVVQ